jgi:hypothetical protein
MYPFFINYLICKLIIRKTENFSNKKQLTGLNKINL